MRTSGRPVTISQASVLNLRHLLRMFSKKAPTKAMLKSIPLVLWLLLASANAEFTCTAEGIFADPDHCENYIQCALGDINGDGSYDFMGYVYNCPQGSGGVDLYDACLRVSSIKSSVSIDLLMSLILGL